MPVLRKKILSSASTSEKEWCWHKKCVKIFFQTKEMPVLDITKEQLEKLFKQIDVSYLSEEQKKQVKMLVQERMNVFTA